MVVIVHSNSFPRFGSGIVVAGYDLVLANRAGRGFSPIEGHPNFPKAGRRPATTLHAWAAGGPDGAGVRLMGGTPGGANQMPWNAQIAGARARRVRRAGHARDCTRVGVAARRRRCADRGRDVRRRRREALRAAAPRVISASRWGCKSAQQVVRVPNVGEVWSAPPTRGPQGAAIGV